MNCSHCGTELKVIKWGDKVLGTCQKGTCPKYKNPIPVEGPKPTGVVFVSSDVIPRKLKDLDIP